MIVTTEGLKAAKDEISNLLQEKNAWELGNEVYKCDNSKLLSEVNKLKLELLNKEKNTLIENAGKSSQLTARNFLLNLLLELRRKIRNLGADKKEADDKINALTQAVYQFSHTDKTKKILKPFVSTVRSNTLFPDAAFIADVKSGSFGGFHKGGVNKEIEKLRNDLRYTEDVLSVLKKQEDQKDREIQRLNCLFVGGRPPSALAKDCCYKGVSKITEDVGILQRDKIELQSKLSEYLEDNEKLHSKWKEQKKKVSQLEAYVREISEAALFVEREANLKIKNQNRDISELKEDLKRATADGKSKEIKSLRRTLKEKNQQEQKLTFEVEYLKNKLNENEQKLSSKNSELVAELIKERDILHNKIQMLTLRKKPDEECDVNRFYCQLKEKENTIHKLQEELLQLKCESTPATSGHGSLAISNTLRRTECERDCALNKVQTLKMEIEALNDKMRVYSDTKINESKRTILLEETIAKLKFEVQDLQTSKTPAFQTIKQLREDNCELQIKLRSADEDYKKLNSTYNQVKMLSQQTESVLMNAQNQLEFTKCELSEREAQICCISKSNDCLKEQIEKLTTEITKLKTLKSTVEREKDFYMMSLDKKSEKLQCVESKVESVMQLRDTSRIMKAQIE